MKSLHNILPDQDKPVGDDNQKHVTQWDDIPSAEVQEIFERTPSWLLRWGISTIAFILFLMVLASIFLRYPDILISKISITTKRPPINLVARSAGKLHLVVEDGRNASRNDVLAYIENPAQYGDVLTLLHAFDSIEIFTFSNRIGFTDFHLTTALHLGEIQNDYLLFVSSVKDLQQYNKLKLHTTQIASLQDRIVQFKKLNTQLENQLKIQEEELALMRKKLAIDERLYHENVISEVDFNRTKIEFLQVSRAVEFSKNNLINNGIAISELDSKVSENSIIRSQKQEELLIVVRNKFKQLETQLELWQQKYLFRAPIDGEVSIFRFYTSDQFVNVGDEIMTIIPDSKEIYGQVLVPIGGSGKIESGQRVNIKLDGYPFIEYGTINGEVGSISPVPKDDVYTIQIRLPKGLTTSYGKTLPFKQQLSGTAEIITKDMSIFERVVYSIRSLFEGATR